MRDAERARDNTPLERPAAAVYFTCGRASRVRRRGRSTALRYPAMQTSADPALTLDYRSPRPAPTIGNLRLVRLVAVLTSAVLLALIGHFLQRSRETLGGMSDW